MQTLIRAFAATLFVVGIPQLSSAQDSGSQHPLLEDRVIASAGLFYFDRDVKLRVAGTLTANREIDFNRSTKLSSNENRFAGNLRWRFGEKWSVAAQYFDSKDGGRAELTEDVPWRDVVFREGTFIEAGFEVTVGRLFFGRIFSAGPRHEFGLGAGAHWLELGAYIGGEARINDQSSGLYRDSVDAAAPLPNIGVWYSYVPTSKWLVDSRVDWFSASFDEYSGSLWNAAVGVQYQAFRHFGIGLTYQYFSLEVDVDNPGWQGAADLRFTGPFLSLTTNW